MSSRAPNPTIDCLLDVPGHGRLLVRDIPGAEVFEVEGDRDACVRLPEFPPTLVHACLSVAGGPGVLPGSPLAAGVDHR